MKIVADFHTHSTASDGVLPPTRLIELAKDAGLSAMALTDHDTVKGIPEALDAARKMNLRLIPGIELSCGWPDNDIPLHVLGLFIDHTNPALNKLLNDQQTARYSRAFKILDRLESLDINVTPLREEFLKHPDQLLGRPHIARFLVATKVVTEFQHAFDRYLKRGRPAHVPKTHLLPETAIEVIHQAGGLAFVAHPGLINEWDQAWKIIGACPWDGLEVFYSEHDSDKTLFFQNLARENSYLMTGGSDYHGDYGKHSHKLGIHGMGQDAFETLMNNVEPRRLKTRQMVA